MQYRKVALEVVVDEEEEEILMQALNDAMDKVANQVAVFASSIKVMERGEPENAEEIAAPAR